MRTSLFLAVFALCGCGTSPKSVCAGLNASSQKFFPLSAVECVSRDSATTVTVTQWGLNTMGCEMAAAKCTSAELATLDTYVACLDKAPTCAEGAEAAATSAVSKCISDLLAKTPGPECVAALR